MLLLWEATIFLPLIFSSAWLNTPVIQALRICFLWRKVCCLLVVLLMSLLRQSGISSHTLTNWVNFTPKSLKEKLPGGETGHWSEVCQHSSVPPWPVLNLLYVLHVGLFFSQSGFYFVVLAILPVIYQKNGLPVCKGCCPSFCPILGSDTASAT